MTKRLTPMAHARMMREDAVYADWQRLTADVTMSAHDITTRLVDKFHFRSRQTLALYLQRAIERHEGRVISSVRRDAKIEKETRLLERYEALSENWKLSLKEVNATVMQEFGIRGTSTLYAALNRARLRRAGL